MQTIDDYGKLIHLIPGPIYIKNANSVYLYLNEFAFQISGFKSYDDIIGKNDYQLWPKEFADQIVKHDQEVVRTQKPVINKEETILQENGKVIYFSVIKMPLFDNNGNFLGIIGNSTDITPRKQKELLSIENERQQQKFRKIVAQVMHDIQSPLSSLQTIVKNTLEIPEQKRIALRNIAISIGDITNHLLNQYKPENKHILSTNNTQQPLLVSLTLSEILSNKRHECKDLPIRFEYTFSPLCSFAFIKAEPSNFKRMIINLINNSIDSMPKKGGEIKLEFAARDDYVHIGIEDTGKGITNSVLHAIENSIPITKGKENGHGIGLTQVRETVTHNHGEFKISSKVGKNHGTEIALTFPRLGTPNWIAEEINLTKDDIIIVLDDDASIHEAWDSRFSHIIEKIQTITVKHFTQGQEVIDYIDKLPETIKQNIYLLSDYELIKQELNGLQVIEQVKIKRSTLVTSHYTNNEIHKLAVKHAVRILPKELVYNVPLKITQAKLKGELSFVHIVFVDDEKFFTDNLIANYYSHLVIDTYTNPYEFLNKADQYPLDTRIILDNNYYNDDGSFITDGISIAKRLHKRGFNKLYLLSGERVKTPDYLIPVFKNNEETLAKLDKL